MFRRLFTIATFALGLAAAAPLHAQQPDGPRPERAWHQPRFGVRAGPGRRIHRRHRRRAMRRIAFRRGMRYQRMRMLRGQR